MKVIRKQILFPILEKNHWSNAFPDVVYFKNKEYIAFRTANIHFPTSNSKIAVYSRQEDGTTWEKECEFSIPTFDVRNPKFFLHNDSLYLLFAATPVGLFHKESDKIYLSQITLQSDNGHSWKSPISIKIPEPLSPFRVRYDDENTPILSTFRDYLRISEFFKQPKVAFLYPFTPYEWREYPFHTKIDIKGTETDFIENNEHIFIISRMDFSIDGRNGTKIIRISKKTDEIIDKTTRIKLDAPYLFYHKDNLFILARKNIFFKGRYNLLPKFVPDIMRTIVNSMIYWLTPKRLALWKLDQTSLTVKHIFDFPVQGDTGYAVVGKINGNVAEIITYSSIKGKYLPWFMGQLWKTQIVSFLIDLTN